MPALKYLSGYPESLRAQVRDLLAEGRLGEVLLKRYPSAHGVRSDKALYDYVCALKNEGLRGAASISKVMWDNSLHITHKALGTHTNIARVQGGKLKAKREIRIATLFREVPEAFLRMIVVHELAHLKEREHDKAFYALCCHMEADYHRLELDLRIYLCYQDAAGTGLWSASP